MNPPNDFEKEKYTEEQLKYHSDTILEIFRDGIKSGKNPPDVIGEIQEFVGAALRTAVARQVEKDAKIAESYWSSISFKMENNAGQAIAKAIRKG